MEYFSIYQQCYFFESKNKGDGVFVVKINVPPQTDKTEFHSEFIQEYEKRLKLIEEKYQLKIEHKEELIDIYRKQNIDLKEIVCYQAERPIHINTKAEAKGGTWETINMLFQGMAAYQ